MGPLLLLALVTSCSEPPSSTTADSGEDPSACECREDDACLYNCCTPVDPVNCTDCDCDGFVDGEDCNDQDAFVHPGAPEYLRCDYSNAGVHGGPDGIDNDCDGIVDEDAEAAAELCNGIDDDCDDEVDEGVMSAFFPDVDGDSWGHAPATIACEAPSGYTNRDGDCNDADPAVNPDGAEVHNGVDDDCDGLVDE